MPLPRSAIASILNVSKGLDLDSALMHDAPFSDSVLSAAAYIDTGVPAGRACHLDSAGDVLLGVHKSGVTLFSFTHTADPDVSVSRGDTSLATGDANAWVGEGSNRKVFYVATGGFEIETTEYDDTEDYPPNTRLTALVNVLATGGVLIPQTDPAEEACGVVSRGLVSSGYHNPPSAYVPAGATPALRNLLAFWSVYKPSNTVLT